MEHTPGKWQANDNGACVFRQTEHGRDILAEVYGTKRGDLAERKANAELISAAPELYEACKAMNELLKAVSIVAYTPEVLPHLPFGLADKLKAFNKSTHIDAAIAKAEGRA